MPEDDSSPTAARRREERRRIGEHPHVDGITRGTVLEYDGWQWAVVTEIAADHEPPQIGFVLVDELGDEIVAVLESAWGCAEHYDAMQPYRDSEYEYWADIEFVRTDDSWTALGPIHPDARTTTEVTDGV
ncbi:hypothetical protein [Halobaculum gomorrense]|uniref:Uncharacterized protein n=1 Tax=Halobaculum gomorrense TaxID=43928 RepID=A0A1M5UTB1_9EURY|nr:hypothetical protein [Halobaculum gomorrense]SHH66058.1 hypothetical protein SAMN05443636_3123 [Halobaculum gomorrense]